MVRVWPSRIVRSGSHGNDLVTERGCDAGRPGVGHRVCRGQFVLGIGDNYAFVRPRASTLGTGERPVDHPRGLTSTGELPSLAGAEPLITPGLGANPAFAFARHLFTSIRAMRLMPTLSDAASLRSNVATFAPRRGPRGRTRHECASPRTGTVPAEPGLASSSDGWAGRHGDSRRGDGDLHVHPVHKRRSA